MATSNTVELHMRVSDFRAWLDCRRRFFLHNVYGVQVDTELDPTRSPNNADIGTLVDHGLNKFFTGDAARLIEAPNVPDVPMLSDEWMKAIETAQIMLDGFYEWWEEQPESASLEPLEVQKEVARWFGPFHVAGPEKDLVLVRLVGHIDMLAYDHRINGISINDFKTVATLMQGPLQIDTQLNLYALLANDADYPVKIARHIQLRRVKRTARATPPFYAIRPVIINPTQLERTTTLLYHALRDMVTLRPWDSPLLHEASYYPSPSGECDWKCKMRQVCGIMDDGTDWESVVELAYGRSEQTPLLTPPTPTPSEEE